MTRSRRVLDYIDWIWRVQALTRKNGVYRPPTNAERRGSHILPGM